MGIFNYKNFSSKQSAEMVLESSKMAIYSNAASFFGFPGAKILNWAGKLLGNLPANKYDISIPEGWRELAPQELGLPASAVDRKGYYTFDSPAIGKAPNGFGPQTKILGKFENGQLTKVSVAIAGTNDILDVADYFHINNSAVVPPLEKLLTTVKDYVLKHNLTSEDVIITGYSLGGALTNLVAKNSEVLSDGFFNEANYFAYASPYVYDNADKILNIGFENDAVYRFLGEEASLKESFANARPGAINPDKTFGSSIDNMILFGKTYASIFWNEKSASIFSRIQGWKAHGQAVRSDAMKRIIESKFYDYMDKDSRIIIDQLDILKRWNTWVQDKTSVKHQDHGVPAFIIGNSHSNMLKGGRGGDYLEGLDGNDRLQPGKGADRVDGGQGWDNLVLEGRATDWSAYRLSDGTLFMYAKDKSGMKQVENVERVEFTSEIMTWSRPYSVEADGIYDHRFLIKSWNKNTIRYSEHQEGTYGDDVLVGTALFGKAGNDKLTAKAYRGSLLHGGEGDDILIGGRGSDEIYGAEGNDVIYASGGTDILYGGVGNDTFIFNKINRGRTTIKDFNDYAGDNDKLLFTKSLFKSADDVLSSMKQVGKDVHLYKYGAKGISVVFEHVSLDEFNHSNIGII